MRAAHLRKYGMTPGLPNVGRIPRHVVSESVKFCWIVVQSSERSNMNSVDETLTDVPFLHTRVVESKYTK
jgi:hypothetical protein